MTDWIKEFEEALGRFKAVLSNEKLVLGSNANRIASLQKERDVLDKEIAERKQKMAEFGSAFEKKKRDILADEALSRAACLKAEKLAQEKLADATQKLAEADGIYANARKQESDATALKKEWETKTAKLRAIGV